MSLPDDAVERVARAMCRAASEDPDAQIFAGQPVMTLGGYRTVGPSRPAWQVRAYEARCALREVLAMVEETKAPS